METTKKTEFRLFDFQTNDKGGKFIIEMFGINEHGETAYIKVNDFRPFFYLLVDDKWTDRTTQRFIKTVIEPKVKNASETVKGVLCEKKKIVLVFW